MSDEEIKRLKQYCMVATPEEKKVLLEMCQSKDFLTGDDMYYHLTSNVSYDRLDYIRYVPTSKRRFYQRCTEVLETFKKFLIENNNWE